MNFVITESQLDLINSFIQCDNILSSIYDVKKHLNEDEEKEPDMVWDFTDVKEKIDLSKKWVQTKEQAIEYVDLISEKIKNFPESLKTKIKKYLIYSFIGLLTANQITQALEPSLKKIDTEVKRNVENVVLGLRKSSDKLLNHLKWEEGSIYDKGEPNLVAYNLGDGAYTIGYGHAIFPYEEEGYDFLPEYDEISPGNTKITKDQAEELLMDDVKDAEKIVNKILNDWEEQGIKPKITQGMYDAMVSMTFNMGPGIRTSEFIQYVKVGDLKRAKEEILKTSSNLFDDYPGLEIRRQKESEMFK
jgi:GH24 family phage-related lysozyme (muramidase)